MSLRHTRMINSAYKCLKITLKVIKFSKPETNFLKKLKLRGWYPPLNHLRGDLSPIPPLAETMLACGLVFALSISNTFSGGRSAPPMGTVNDFQWMYLIPACYLQAGTGSACCLRESFLCRNIDILACSSMCPSITSTHPVLTEQDSLNFVRFLIGISSNRNMNSRCGTFRMCSAF
jgi:hypothetical protein